MERNRAFEDERISAYVDGELSEDERAAFEAALAQDATLRRKVAVTQLLVREARALQQQAVPRNFILPREAVKQMHPPSSSEEEQMPVQDQESALRVMVRLGAALVVFAVVFIGLLQVLPSTLVPRSPAPLAVQPTLPASPAVEESTPRMMPMLVAPESAAQPEALNQAPARSTPPAAAPQEMPLRSPRPLTMVILAVVLLLGLAGFWVIRARRR